MKSPDTQIISILQGFKEEDVLQAIEAYKIGIENRFLLIEKDLKVKGWYTVSAKPENKEYYFINDKYWIQTEEARLKDIARVKDILKKQAEVLSSKPRKKRTNLELLKIETMYCPKCGGSFYKQKICPGCKEGKKGYSVRLICDENSDHEFLI